MKKHTTNIIIIILAMLDTIGINANNPNISYREIFLNPARQHKPIIIWQWMDGLVTRQAITNELEAFKEAGLAGVQNFQIGGHMQSLIGDSTCAIGSEKWNEMIKWTLDECARLGLEFGTHNCPGWSSSAYRNVTPEYSMQKLVYSETPLKYAKPKKIKGKRIQHVFLPKPEVDSISNFYRDIAVIAIPDSSNVRINEVIDLTSHMDINGCLNIPADVMIKLRENTVLLRIGHTTNGKTNHAQSPESGKGLECDKMRREAVKFFWNGYPKMLIDIAGEHAGKSFTCFEIDSYEAGGQNWSVVLPEEFKSRKGYEIIPYLPYLIGRTTVGPQELTDRFNKDIIDVATSLVAENYYGYMAELASQTPGLKLLIEPYGTGRQQPFQIIDTRKILAATPDAIIATEFWVEPQTWGWKDMARHEKEIRRTHRPLLYAEGFTCWPLFAWQTDPASLKPICDRAFCNGVNRMMLHAGAVNPWQNVEPGMSFGIWGTHFVPTQTWWKAGGANALFAYMSRCQALLQCGVPADEQQTVADKFESYHRIDAGNHIIFICNPTDSFVSDTIVISRIANGKNVEIWNPYNLSMTEAPDSDFTIDMEPGGSRFVIITNEKIPSEFTDTLSSLLTHKPDCSPYITLDKGWSMQTSGSRTDESICYSIDTLIDWSKSEINDLKYYSGTITYTNTFVLDNKPEDKRIVLSLGDVRNMASVRVNDHRFPVMWKAPYYLDITEALKIGKNKLEIDITNLWPNRMIGDEQEPDDIEWSEPLVYDYAPGKPEAGRFMKTIPDWLRNGTPRPSSGRKTVGCFKFFRAESPLLPSGLLGPVDITLVPE